MLTTNPMHILERIRNFDRPERTALSRRFPRLTPYILAVRHTIKHLQNISKRIARTVSTTKLPHTLARHQSLLLRRLGDSDPRLQQQKITNLRTAASHLNGLIIKPGETFSLWETIGRPTAKRGYTYGMLLSNGTVTEGIGGGLCQMANLLYWLFLHSPLTITERHHHSRDVFPDSGRVLPFGSGATIMYNFVDLQVKNTTNKPVQIIVWLTDKHLKGTLRTDTPLTTRYHIVEKNHTIYKERNRHFRYNELWREVLVEGQATSLEYIITNFAPVLYSMDAAYCSRLGYTYRDISSEYQTFTTKLQPLPHALPALATDSAQ